MNYTESFDEFAGRLSSTDLALYAGAALLVWVLFKDKFSPIQKFFTDLLGKTKELTLPNVNTTTLPTVDKSVNKEDLFFKLIVSWKQTRDLAISCNCPEAVKVADQMFPYLSPEICNKTQS